MAASYRDRVVHQWYVENFIEPYFVPQFIETSYAGIKGRGMHKASKDVQKAMEIAKNKWNEYYIFIIVNHINIICYSIIIIRKFIYMYFK